MDLHEIISSCQERRSEDSIGHGGPWADESPKSPSITPRQLRAKQALRHPIDAVRGFPQSRTTDHGETGQRLNRVSLQELASGKIGRVGPRPDTAYSAYRNNSPTAGRKTLQVKMVESKLGDEGNLAFLGQVGGVVEDNQRGAPRCQRRSAYPERAFCVRLQSMESTAAAKSELLCPAARSSSGFFSRKATSNHFIIGMGTQISPWKKASRYSADRWAGPGIVEDAPGRSRGRIAPANP